VVVRLRGPILRDHGEAPGHAEVHQQVALREIEQEVFPAAADVDDFSTAQAACEVARHGPAKARVANDHVLDRPPDHAGHEAAAGRLDFGKFRHLQRIIRAGLQRLAPFPVVL
jgi:hypothetical protein